MIEAELPDGRVLEFPDGTPPEVIQGTVKKMLGVQDAAKQEPQESEIKNLAGEVLRQTGLTARYGLEGIGGGAVANILGLPSPKNSTERVVRDIGTAVSTGLGVTGLARLGQKAYAKAAPYLESMVARPGATAISSAGAGAGEGIAREGGFSPTEQTYAAIAGGILAPGATALGRRVGGSIADVASAANVARGGTLGLERMTRDAANRLVEDGAKGKVKTALMNATEMVPGARPTVGEAIAEAQRPGERFGGALSRMQKTLTGAVGAEDVLPANMAAQENAVKTFVKGVEKRLGPTREGLLARANVSGGVDAAPILQRIDTYSALPKNAASDIASKALKAVRDKIAGLQRQGTTTVDANAIYTVRKELSKNIKMAAKESANWDKKAAGVLERDIQMMIDDAINRSIDPTGKTAAWTSGYMKPYAQSMASVRAHEDRLDQMKAINRIVKSRVQNLAQGDVPSMPNLLNRWAQITNFVVRKVIGDANDPVTKSVAQKMTDPVEFAKLLDLPPADPSRQLAEKVASQIIGVASSGTVFSVPQGEPQ